MRQIEEEKGIKSKTLEQEPVLGRHLHWIWEAFSELNYRRAVAGMGAALPIPFTEIDAYCRLKHIFLPNDLQRLVYLVGRLDREWGRLHAEKMEKESPSTSKSQTPPPSHSPPRGGGTRKPRRPVS